MTRHCMLDLETLGKRPGCIILSIGACVFTEQGLDSGADFHAFLEVGTQAQVGFHADPETALWWMSQSDAARAAQCGAARQPVGKVLLDFKDWFRANEAEMVWSNGADFDIPILAEMFRVAGAPVPWKYNAGRCVRSIMALTDRKLGGFGTPNALAHDALADAQFQAREVAAAMRWLRDRALFEGQMAEATGMI